MKCEPLDGEMFRFHVWSRSRPDIAHLVDIEAFGFNGRCSCERFTFAYQASLEAGQLACEAFRCPHIKRARSYFLDQFLPKIASALRKQGVI
jgi:hypothetical protein